MSVHGNHLCYRLVRNICRVCLLVLVVLACAIATTAQECPKTSATGATVPSEVQTLEGRLVYHDGIRKWFELKLAEQKCEQTSIQLVSLDDWAPIEVLRGCQVRTKGALDLASTGYYSLDVYQSVDLIKPVGACSRRAPLPDYSKIKPDRSIRNYRVDMQVDYESGDHPIIFRVSSSGKELQPWQAYASYMLTGGFVLYGHCAEGFVVDKVFGTPEANPSHFDGGNMAAFDPESAAASGNKNLRLGYTCVRQH